MVKLKACLLSEPDVPLDIKQYSSRLGLTMAEYYIGIDGVRQFVFPYGAFEGVEKMVLDEKDMKPDVKGDNGNSPYSRIEKTRFGIAMRIQNTAGNLTKTAFDSRKVMSEEEMSFVDEIAISLDTLSESLKGRKLLGKVPNETK